MRETVKLYQLVALGSRGALEGLGKIYSKRVFSDEPSASGYIEEFKTVCCRPKDDYDLFYLERVDRVGIVELELRS